MAQITRQRDYSDLDLDFIAHPITRDVSRKTGPEAIVRSIRNLVLTNYYDRPFRPWLGSNVQKMLFENIDPLTASSLEKAIRQVITNFEPRASVLGVKVTVGPDANGFDVKIVFSINNRPEPYQITVFLERIR